MTRELVQDRHLARGRGIISVLRSFTQQLFASGGIQFGGIIRSDDAGLHGFHDACRTRWLIVLLAATSAAAAAAGCAAAGTMGQVLFRIPGTDYDLMLGGPARAPTVGPEPALVHAIALWLAQEFELSSIQRYPAIKIVSSDAMISLRYRGLLPINARVEGASNSEAPAASDILAIYSDRDETIYLAEGWNSGTAAGLSVLVHEMVHHLQRVLGLRHECPQEREKLAYQAQERWLGLFGHSLEKDFRLDGFSLLVKTRCF